MFKATFRIGKRAIGPGHFTTAGDAWTDGYSLVPCGLMAPPRLIVRK